MTDFGSDTNHGPMLEASFGRAAAHAAALAIACGAKRVAGPGRWMRTCLRLFGR